MTHCCVSRRLACASCPPVSMCGFDNQSKADLLDVQYHWLSQSTRLTDRRSPPSFGRTLLTDTVAITRRPVELLVVETMTRSETSGVTSVFWVSRNRRAIADMVVTTVTRNNTLSQTRLKADPPVGSELRQHKEDSRSNTSRYVVCLLCANLSKSCGSHRSEISVPGLWSQAHTPSSDSHILYTDHHSRFQQHDVLITYQFREHAHTCTQWSVSRALEIVNLFRF